MPELDHIIIAALVVLLFLERGINFTQSRNERDEIEYRVQKIAQSRANAEKDATQRTLACLKEARELLDTDKAD